MKTLHITSFSNGVENWSGSVPMTDDNELCDAIYNAADDLYSGNDDNPEYHQLTDAICRDMSIYDSASFEIGGFTYVYFNIEE